MQLEALILTSNPDLIKAQIAEFLKAWHKCDVRTIPRSNSFLALKAHLD